MRLWFIKWCFQKIAILKSWKVAWVIISDEKVSDPSPGWGAIPKFPLTEGGKETRKALFSIIDVPGEIRTGIPRNTKHKRHSSKQLPRFKYDRR
jgi:hypothetical protein